MYYLISIFVFLAGYYLGYRRGGMRVLDEWRKWIDETEGLD